jgi:hypothetical protein
MGCRIPRLSAQLSNAAFAKQKPRAAGIATRGKFPTGERMRKYVTAIGYSTNIGESVAKFYPH